MKVKPKLNLKINRKGMMDDAFDLLFTVMIMVFAFLLLFGMLSEGDSDKKEIAQDYATKANYAYDAVSNFRNTELKEGIFSDKSTLETNAMRNLISSLSSKLPREINKNKQTTNSEETETNLENQK
ncbi:hypothetical protein J4437_03185 [Candidatus Woesearchaeota archaeon]|nr:hypothetical protein [Candidatus Woesearchaeota archaeon]